MRRALIFLTVLSMAVLAVGCGDDDGSDVRADSGSESGSSSDGDDDTTMSEDDFVFDEGDTFDGDLSNEEVVENIQEFWSERADLLDGTDYEPLPEDRVSAVPTEDGDDEGPVCFGAPISPEDVANNAFASPCPEGLTVSWDPELLDGFLTENFGEAGPAVVLAHEWGHIMQFQSGILDESGFGTDDPPSVFVENQADCFAGAWVQQQVEDEYGPFVDPGALDNSIGAMISVRDQPGSSPDDPLAHGSGFDRVRAFQDGVNQGVEYCYGYLEDPPFIEQLPFSEADLQTGGNLPFDEIVELATLELDTYYDGVVDDFEGPGDPFDIVPEDDLEDLSEEIGDGAVLTVFGMLWSERAQAAAGEDVDGEGPLLQRACLVGAWLGDILQDQRVEPVERESGIRLSPGDLDEAIITFLRLTDEAMSGAGVAFEAVTDMRIGVFGGIEDCRLGE